MVKLYIEIRIHLLHAVRINWFHNAHFFSDISNDFAFTEGTAVIHAELSHNPYLLQTHVKFNGLSPRINSQVEKYDNIALNDWIEKVPMIFHDEMNGYNFDLYFTGTSSDFANLRATFARAGISEGEVRLFHKNELEEAETKSRAIDVLIQWLRDNKNRRFDFAEFHERYFDLFEGAYPYMIINGPAADSIHPQIGMEFIKTADELKDAVLTHTPVLFFIDAKSADTFRNDLATLLHRKDVRQNQLFFMIHPQLNTEQIRRVIVDLGVDNPQLVSSYGANDVLMYFRNYPITEFIRGAIEVFERETQALSVILEEENQKSKVQNAEIHAVIARIETQITRLKQSDTFFTERDNFSAGHTFSALQNNLYDQISKWRNKKTKIVGDDECAAAAVEYDVDIAKYLVGFVSSAKEAYRQIAGEIQASFRERYTQQGLCKGFVPSNVQLPEPPGYQPVALADEFVALKEVTYEEQKYDLKSLFRISSAKEDKEPVRIATCYYAQWREKAWKLILPVVQEFIERCIDQLNDYYNALAEAYHEQLSALIDGQETEKDEVSAQLSDDELKLQRDNDWLADFREQLEHIERG